MLPIYNKTLQCSILSDTGKHTWGGDTQVLTVHLARFTNILLIVDLWGALSQWNLIIQHIFSDKPNNYTTNHDPAVFPEHLSHDVLVPVYFGD